jgi:hypothetical protein
MIDNTRRELPTNDAFYFFAEQLVLLQLLVAAVYTPELFSHSRMDSLPVGFQTDTTCFIEYVNYDIFVSVLYLDVVVTLIK